MSNSNSKVFTITFRNVPGFEGDVINQVLADDAIDVFAWAHAERPGQVIEHVSYKYLAADLTPEVTQ
jgi:hypothetical protein